jgi:hypothetical protein
MRFRNVVSSTGLLFIGIISLASLSREVGAQSDCGTPGAVPDSVIVDTLPRFENIRGAARDKPGHIRAATDALIGRSSFPPPLVVTKYRREGSSVFVDLKADSLPQVRWTNAGGLVRIRGDGCRIVVTRHR